MKPRRNVLHGAESRLQSSRCAVDAQARRCPRLFTSNHTLLVTSRRNPARPQVPFLGSRPSHLPVTFSGKHLVRLLSTENAKYYKDQTLLGLKWGVAAWLSLSLVGFALYTFKAEKLDQRRPTPAEWSYSSRELYRESWFVYLEARKSSKKVNWTKVGRCMYNCLLQLEDQSHDGRDTVRIQLPGEAEPGWSAPLALDVSKKSEAWKAGYFEAAMRGGHAAERAQNLLLDTTTGAIYPKSTVIGPSNPFPRTMRPGSMPPAKEEDCESALPDPALFYNRIIYGVGFSPEQRIDAILAHASFIQTTDWAAAENLFTHAIEVAEAAIPSTDLGSHEPVTSNLINARIQHAGFLARTSRAPSALPVYLSCLRSVRHASSSPSTSRIDPLSTISAPPPPSIWTFLDNKYTRSDAYPLRIATGNESLSSLPDADLGSLEAELRLYIGEILYSTGKYDDGLEWTKEAVTISRGVLKALPRPVNAMLLATKEEAERGVKAQECLVAALRNWERMADLLGRKGKVDHGVARTGWRNWLSWNSASEHDVVEKAKEEALDAAVAKSQALDQGLVRLVQFFDSPRD